MVIVVHWFCLESNWLEPDWQGTVLIYVAIKAMHVERMICVSEPSSVHPDTTSVFLLRCISLGVSDLVCAPGPQACYFEYSVM